MHLVSLTDFTLTLIALRVQLFKCPHHSFEQHLSWFGKYLVLFPYDHSSCFQWWGKGPEAEIGGLRGIDDLIQPHRATNAGLDHQRTVVHQTVPLKRWIAVLLTAMLAIMLQAGATAESDNEISNFNRYTDYTPQAAEPVGLIPGENHRTLVVWFSRVGNTVFDPDVDVVSSATLNRGEDGALLGNAQMIAGWIAEETGADRFLIQTAYTYPSDYHQTVQVGEGQDSSYGAQRGIFNLS